MNQMWNRLARGWGSFAFAFMLKQLNVRLPSPILYYRAYTTCVQIYFT